MLKKKLNFLEAANTKAIVLHKIYTIYTYVCMYMSVCRYATLDLLSVIWKLITILVKYI